MGIGNLTELTDVDSAGINTLLLGFCQETGIRSVLTTEVIHWAASSVKECDLARRLVWHAVTHRTLPKHVEPRLVTLRSGKPREHGPEALDRLAAAIRDPNFRIFAEGGMIHLLGAGLHLESRDPFALFDDLQAAGRDDVDPSHAFYLGYEMAKAVTALTLGKDYRQDQALDWGHLTQPEIAHGPSRAAARAAASRGCRRLAAILRLMSQTRPRIAAIPVPRQPEPIPGSPAASDRLGGARGRGGRRGRSADGLSPRRHAAARALSRLGPAEAEPAADEPATLPPLGRWSFVAADPIHAIRSSRSPIRPPPHGPPPKPSPRCRQLLADLAAPTIPGLPPFQGGLAGLDLLRLRPRRGWACRPRRSASPPVPAGRRCISTMWSSPTTTAGAGAGSSRRACPPAARSAVASGPPSAWRHFCCGPRQSARSGRPAAGRPGRAWRGGRPLPAGRLSRSRPRHPPRAATGRWSPAASRRCWPATSSR